ncbi:MAG: sulfatase, partial [Actinomycetota bacterium]|nr:sulfatase [Actinomycetota bacterium]
MALDSGGLRKAKLAIATAATAGVALVLALGLGGHHAASAEARPPQQQPLRPNVLVIETDDQTQASMSVMPNTQQLIGGQGTTFANNFVNYSLCCPSRSTFLTGQYSHNTGVRDNQPPNGGFDKLNSSNTLPLWLQGAGYYTGLIGKYLNGYETHRNDPGGPLIPPGWSEWRGSTVTYQYFGYELNEGGVLNTYGSTSDNPDNPPNPSLYSTDVYTAKAVDFINRRAPTGQPFFLWLTYLAPHGGGPNPPGSHCVDSAHPAPRDLHAFDSVPLPQPPSFNEADISDKPPNIRDNPPFSPTDISDIQRNYRCRLASLLAEDAGVKQLIDTLSANGVLDNTLVIFTSDNGFMHGEHRVKTGKVVPYEESIRVPLLIRGPGFSGGKTVRDLSINADLAPTVVKATGAQPGLTTDGLPLQGFPQKPGRERGRELSIEALGYTGVRTQRYIYIEHTGGQNNGFQELYDLQADPFELQNVASNPAYAAVRAALAARLANVRTCSGDACRLLPRLRVKLRKRKGPHGCARRPVKARVKGTDRSGVAQVEFFVNGKHFVTDRKAPFLRKLPYRKLKRKRHSTVR